MGSFVTDKRILIACEFSGVVRDAFIRRGFDAVSCDYLPSESYFGPHIQGNVKSLLREPWDLVIAHPPCTYLCNSGVSHLTKTTGTRWNYLDAAAEFFLECLNANAPRVAVENPTMHKYAIERIGRKEDFAVQPWQFGHGETKRTCFWIKNLPVLIPTNVVSGREARLYKLPPSKNRSKERSRTYLGIAEAMADQWGNLLRDQ